MTTRKRRAAARCHCTAAVPEPAGERADAPEREQPAGVVAGGVLLGERGDRDLEHAERDRGQSQRDDEHADARRAERAGAAVPGSRCAGRQRRESGDATTPSAAGRLERDGGQEAHLGRDRGASVAASSGPTMNTSSSSSASSANAVSSRSGRRARGSACAARAESGGTLAPATKASTVTSATLAPAEHRHHQRDAGDRRERRMVTSGFVCPTRSIMRPSTGAAKPTLKPRRPP